MRRTVLFCASSLLFAACGTPQMIDPMETPKTSGSMTCDPMKYPCGPYGYWQGSTIQDVELVGQRDSNGNGVIDSGDAVVPIHLSDYFQNKSTKAIFVGVAAGWCGPCKMEQPGLVSASSKYKTQVGFLEALIEDASGNPADTTFVDSVWAARYQIPFDLAADPASVLGPYYAQGAFPMQMVIRTSDMSIQYQSNGAPLSEVQTAIDQILAAP
jgi:hypothetical protein